MGFCGGQGDDGQRQGECVDGCRYEVCWMQDWEFPGVCSEENQCYHGYEDPQCADKENGHWLGREGHRLGEDSSCWDGHRVSECPLPKPPTIRTATTITTTTTTINKPSMPWLRGS